MGLGSAATKTLLSGGQNFILGGGGGRKFLGWSTFHQNFQLISKKTKCHLA